MWDDEEGWVAIDGLCAVNSVNGQCLLLLQQVLESRRRISELPHPKSCADRSHISATDSRL